jgi:hypothetical protein
MIMIHIPLGGNVFPSPKRYSGVVLGHMGITNWRNHGVAFTAYVYVDQPGSLEVALEVVSSSEEAVMEMEIHGNSRQVVIGRAGSNLYPVGAWEIESKGYIPIIIRKGQTPESNIPLVSGLRLDGTSINEHTVFVPTGVNFGFARRGTSIYLGYPYTGNKEIEWMYCEAVVPQDNDPTGCFNTVIKWAHGYIGLQVLQGDERWVLFSVWSPDKNDNPKMVVDKLKVKEMKKGTNVIVQPFGNEGNGLQSIFRYKWKPGETYRFLVRGVPSGHDHTDFSAYFFEPGENEWKFISCLKRPAESSYLRDFSSFIENFYADYGDIARECLFQNQWVRTFDGHWVELVDAIVDPTLEYKYRLDFDGGIKGRGFYLKTAGFFKGETLPRTTFSRVSSNRPPEIDFSKLENYSDI